MKQTNTSLNLSLIMISLAATLMSACGDENDKDAKFNLNAYHAIGDAKAAELDEAQKNLMQSSILYYVISRSDGAPAAPNSMRAITEQIRTQIRNIESNPAEVKAELNQTNPCFGSGSTENKGQVTSEAKKTDDNVEYFLDSNTSKKILGCNYSDEENDAMTGEVANKLRILVKGKRVAKEDDELNVNFDTSELSYKFEAEFDGSMKFDVGGDKAEVKGFGLAADLSVQDIKDLKDASADPLGGDEREAHKAEWLRKHLMCKGEVVLKGKSYPCESIIAFQIVESSKD